MSGCLYPQYKIEYDSYTGNYYLMRRFTINDSPSLWRLVDSYTFKWVAIMKAKSLIRNDEAERNGTITQVWGPYP